MKSKNRFGSTILWWLIGIVGVVVLIGLASQLWEVIQLSSRLSRSYAEVSQLEQEKQAIEKQLIIESAEEFQEKQIREQLSMSKPNEVVLLLPMDVEALAKQFEVEEDGWEEAEIPYWKQWVELLF